MSSFFPRPQQAIGVMEQNGFYRLVRYRGSYQTVWCCDAFSVEERIMNRDASGNESEKVIIEFIVRFMSLAGSTVEFSWDLISLVNLSKGNQLQQRLCGAGLRCSPEIKAAIAIINAIQCPDLVYMRQEWSNGH